MTLDCRAQGKTKPWPAAETRSSPLKKGPRDPIYYGFIMLFTSIKRFILLSKIQCKTITLDDINRVIIKSAFFKKLSKVKYYLPIGAKH